MILPFILTMAVAFIIGLIQGDVLADIWSRSWDAYYEEVPNDLQH